MGVDYSANFGIGYKIKKASEEVLEEHWEDMGLYLFSILEKFPDRATYITFGNLYYGGLDWGLILEEPFSNGIDLTHAKELLDYIIDSSGLERDSEFGLIGGLQIS